MLTRIEITGFKTFDDFALDLMPFTVILGPNGSGKSNLFDAIQLLSHLAHKGLRDSFVELRGDVDELFRFNAAGSRCDRMALAVEVLLEPNVVDPWGTSFELRHTRMRYEVRLERRRDEKKMERLFVTHESAIPIGKGNDRWSGLFDASPGFKQGHLRYSRRSPFLVTNHEAGAATFEIRSDSRAGRSRSAGAAEATVLSSITNTDFPHLFALRQEMRSWRLLQLDPVALRRPSSLNTPDILQPDGSNLGPMLARIKRETSTATRQDGDISEISAELGRIIPGVLEVDVVEDTLRQEYRVELRFRDGLPFSSRVVSDGTLRVLSLLTMLFDPQNRGLVCFEEPENGIHPARLRTLVETLRGLVIEQLEEESPARPLIQLIMNSHSPVLLAALARVRPAHEVLFADTVAITNGQDRVVNRKTRVRPVPWRDQGKPLSQGQRDFVTSFEVNSFLNTADRGE